MAAPSQPQAGNVAASDQSEEQRGFMNRQPLVFDGKRMRKAVIRKTIDYNSCVIKYLENRKWFKHLNSKHGIQPDEAYAAEILPPSCMPDNPINAVTTKFVRTSTNKLRCPIFCVVWTPEGRRLVTGASSGEFTLWNGLTFNFETILTAHDSPVRSMVWNHHDSWLLSADHSGIVKYWQSNMNNVQMYEAHKEPVRGLSFSPTDNKYASCADDGLVKIWDFYRCTEEKILRGHGADVKCLDWHPHKSLLVSGSKDSQQPIKLWDTRTGNGLATLHLHKNTVMSIKWNQNGNWLLTASRDHLLKLFDIRAMKEIQAFRGHKREATAIAWHPIHENLFASGGSDGSIMFWIAGAEKDVGNMESAHEGMVWSLAWHPLGHILCSGSNDHTSKFWTRNRLGDRMRDRYNLNIQDTEDDLGDEVSGGVRGFSVHRPTAIPGMDTTFSASDSDFLDTHVGLPDFGSSPKNVNFKLPSSRPTTVNEHFTLPGFNPQPPKPGGFVAANQPPPPANFGQNGSGPRFGLLRPDAPAFQPRDGGPPRFQQPGPKQMQGGRQNIQGRNWEQNQPNQPRPGGQFRNDQNQDQFQHGPPNQFGPKGDPRQGPDFRGHQENQGHGFDDHWPPRDQGRSVKQEGWGPDPRRGPPDRGAPIDPRRGPPSDPRRQPDDNRRGPDYNEFPPRDHGPRGFDGKPGILGPAPPAGPDGPIQLPGDRGEPQRNEQPHPFQTSSSSRGFRQGAQGRGAPRDPRGHPEDEFGMPPENRPPFDRDPWGEPPEHERERPHDFRGPPHGMDLDHRGPRDLRGGPKDARDQRGNGPVERRHANEPPRPQDGPKPLMSLLSMAPIAPPPGAENDLDELGLSGPKPMAPRKRPGDDHQHEFDRGWEQHDRDQRDMHDLRNRDPRDSRDRELRDPRDRELRDPRGQDLRDPHDRDLRDHREREFHDPRERELRDMHDRELRDPRDPRQRDPRTNREPRTNRDWSKDGPPIHEELDRGPPAPKQMRNEEDWRIGPPPPGPQENRRDSRGDPQAFRPPAGLQENRRDSHGEPQGFRPPPNGPQENRRDSRGEPQGFRPPPTGPQENRRDSRGEPQGFRPPPTGPQENRRDSRAEPQFGPPAGLQENRREGRGESQGFRPLPGPQENRRDSRGELQQFGPPPGHPDERRNGRGEASFADDHWDDVSWNKNNEQFQGSWGGQR